MLTNKELRAKARADLGGGIFQTMWLLTLVAVLVYSVILGAASYVVIGVILLGGPLEYGLSRVLVSTARGKGEINFGDLFVAFTEDFGGTVALGFFKNLFIFLWSLLLIIPGIVKSYSYSMATYIQQDSEDKNWKTCIDKSREVMNGKKWKLFCLDLSFIGWYIVGFLCLVVGVLFVQPYHLQARTEFYEDIKGELGLGAAEAPAEIAAETTEDKAAE